MVLEKQVKSLWDEIVLKHRVQDNRARYNVVVRQAFMVACNNITPLSLKSIGGVMGKDHSTVIYAKKSHEVNTIYSQDYVILLDSFEELIGKMVEDLSQKARARSADRRIIDNEDGASALLIIEYERQITKLQRKMQEQIEQSNVKIHSLGTQVTIQNNRNHHLSSELLRLKNLL
mgnify:FL=1